MKHHIILEAAPISITGYLARLDRVQADIERTV